MYLSRKIGVSYFQTVKFRPSSAEIMNIAFAIIPPFAVHLFGMNGDFCLYQ